MAITPYGLRNWILTRLDASIEPNWSDQNDVSVYRGVYLKHDYQLQELLKMYKAKIPRLVQLYQDNLEELSRYIKKFDIPKAELKGELEGMKSKIMRIADKWLAVKREIEGREKGWFKREPVGTVYYIDLDGGNDAADGLSTANAWLTIEKYTTVTARSAGDIAYVRAGTSQSKTNADILVDEDGNEDNFIQIIGCDSSVNDPWGDASDVKPSLSFGDAAYKLYFNGDLWWKLERLVVKESGGTYGNVYVLGSCNFRCLDCAFTDDSYASGYGLYIQNSSNVRLENCIFKDNLGTNLYLRRGARVKIDSCTFDGGVLTTDYGIRLDTGASCEIVDSSFGLTTSHDLYDLLTDAGAEVKIRNTEFNNPTFKLGWNCVISEEDVQKVYGTHKSTYYQGKVTKDTGVTRSGGASSSAKFEPNGYCGINNPLTLHAKSLIDSTFKLWVTAAETTITIYIRSFGAWGTYPTNAQLWCEANYLNHASNATRSTQKSTAVLSDETTWVAFTMTFTPLQAGWVYVNVFLNKYEANKGCYVDIKPIIS